MPEAGDGAAEALRLAGASARLAIIRSAAGFALLVVFALGAFLLISAYGGDLVAPPPVEDVAGQPVVAPASILLRVLIALTAVIAAGLVLGKLFAYVGQPPVIGEIVAGILLGPSLIGPEASALILPPHVAPTLGVIAQIGVVLYMFIIGLELHADVLRRRAPTMIAISQTSIILPFLLGAGLALYLYPRMSTSDVPFTSFALFMGVAMAITAFPVLARILSDRKLVRTELGGIALSCAATGDVTAWCLLAFVVGVAKSEIGEGLLVAAATFTYIAVMILLVRPALGRVIARWQQERLPRGGVAFALVALLLSAIATEAIGIHAIFGAFILGAVIPRESAIGRTFTRQFQPLVTVLLLPAFFAYTGMRTRIDLVSGWEEWSLCALIILIATAGKFGGTLLAARLTGLGWRRAGALGALMNTRGLMELIVLNLGLEMGVISPKLFSMMVVMALVTTLMTAPLLRWLVPEGHSAKGGKASRSEDER